jgi:hypothetical protein
MSGKKLAPIEDVGIGFSVGVGDGETLAVGEGAGLEILGSGFGDPLTPGS